jgi:hypothetical protein
MKWKNHWKSMTALALVTVATFGCAQLQTSGGSNDSYPAKMTPMSSQDGVKTVMYRLGQTLGNLESYVSAGPTNDPEVRQDIIRELDKLKQIATSIRDEKVVTKHRQMDQNIDQFIADISFTEDGILANGNPLLP